VAGTHGKTSTSSMTAAAFLEAGEDPTFLIGGELSGLGTNARGGSGRHYVVEADESDGSFLLLDPYCAIVTNIEADHLDHYASLAEIIRTFEEFLARVRPDGVAVLCADDPVLRGLARDASRRTVTYGKDERSDVRLSAYRPTVDGGAFDVTMPDGSVVAGSVATPGEHMALNATAVLAAAWALGVDVRKAAAGIASFAGVKRRFEPVGTVDGVRVIDDYAHHPTEVRATLAAAQASAEAGVWVVFQPHRYTRTAALAREFGDAFVDADRLVLLDVYSAGEAPVPGVSGKTLVDSVLQRHPRTPLAYFPHRSVVADYIARRARRGDIVLTMGAGDVTTVGPEIVRALTECRDAAGGAS
jgi:UDP-N-acetylmuramate--alanine ligase